MNRQDSRPRSRVVVITGASSGIGRACAQYLAERGMRVYGTSRRTQPEPAAVADTGSDPRAFTLLKMDVDDDESVRQAIAQVLEREQHIDVVINNAGIGISGAVEDTSMDEARAQFETNFFGMLRVCHAVLPHMRARRCGTIINVSSIAGVIGVPFNGLYCASKYAVEGLTETLRMEMKPHGVAVCLVEPGDIDTGMSARSIKTVASAGSAVYGQRLDTASAIMINDEANGPPPLVVAKLMEQIILSSSPRLRFVVGPAMEKVAILLKALLPARVFEWGIMKYYKAD